MSLLLLLVCASVCVCVCVCVHVLAAPLPLLNMIESDCFHLRVNGSNLSVTSVASFQQKDKIVDSFLSLDLISERNCE